MMVRTSQLCCQDFAAKILAAKGNHYAMLSVASPSVASPSVAPLPTVTGPVRLNDLPALLGPYATTAPIYVYLMGCGNLTASRFRLKDEEDLILVLKPRPSALRSAV